MCHSIDTGNYDCFMFFLLIFLIRWSQNCNHRQFPRWTPLIALLNLPNRLNSVLSMELAKSIAFGLQSVSKITFLHQTIRSRKKKHDDGNRSQRRNGYREKPETAHPKQSPGEFDLTIRRCSMSFHFLFTSEHLYLSLRSLATFITFRLILRFSRIRAPPIRAYNTVSLAVGRTFLLRWPHAQDKIESCIGEP